MSDRLVSIGVDVARDKLQVAWLRQLDPLQVKPKSLPNTPAGHRELLSWLLGNTGVSPGELQVTLEPTNVYHEGVALFLHDHGCHVCLVNPKKVVDFAGSLGSLSKNDRKDSILLARYGAVMQPKRWQPAPVEVRELHALLDRLDTLTDSLVQEKNRLDTLLMRESPSGVVHASLTDSIRHIEGAIKQLRGDIDDHIDRHPGLKDDQRLLVSIPGVGTLTAQRMIAVIRSKAFTKASQVAAFIGIVPVEQTSGKSVYKKPRISRRGDPQTRAKLYMPVVSAITHNPVVKAFYGRLRKANKHVRAALTAAMRKLVHICFGVLKNRTLFSVGHGVT